MDLDGQVTIITMLIASVAEDIYLYYHWSRWKQSAPEESKERLKHAVLLTTVIVCHWLTVLHALFSPYTSGILKHRPEDVGWWFLTLRVVGFAVAQFGIYLGNKLNQLGEWFWQMTAQYRAPKRKRRRH